MHVPYRGQPGAMGALLAGDVDLFFNQVGPSIGAVEQGQVRALGVTAPAADPALPGVPTMAEACNLPGFTSSTWYGLFGPPGLPAAIQTADERPRWPASSARPNSAVAGAEPGHHPAGRHPPAGFRQTHERDIARWGEIIRKSGASVD